ncbi:Dipeptidyl peptidase 4 [Microbotryomycetes sp. JL201]|nr:Dipeptidyl peptidase 4 [Microbotryomycetes sp. JL201]
MPPGDPDAVELELEAQHRRDQTPLHMLYPRALSALPIPNPLAPWPRYTDDDNDDDDDSDSTLSHDGARELVYLDEKHAGLLNSEDDRWHKELHGSLTLAGTNLTRHRVRLFVAFFMSFLFSGHHSFTGEHLKTMTIEHLANGTFWAERESVDWLAEAGDGVFSYRTDDGSIVLEDVRTNSTRLLVDGDKVKDPSGRKLTWTRFKVSADLKYILFDTDYTKQWRHSSHANFHVHNVETGETWPLRSESRPPHTAIATFSPTNHHIAFVHANDLYVFEEPPSARSRGSKAIRITVDGNPTTFNGVPDWVYEEEVFSADSAMWWSPDGSKLAFLSFDEEQVPEYEFPIYNPSFVSAGAQPYPSSTIMRYPKPGYPNPKVKISVFDLRAYLDSPSDRPTLTDEDPAAPTLDPRVESALYTLELEKPFGVNDTIISEVSWVGSNDLMVKLTNRVADHLRVAHFAMNSSMSAKSITGAIVRETDFSSIDSGWVEPGQTIIGIESTRLLHSDPTISNAADKFAPGYLDILPDKKGFNHVALFSPPENSEPLFLTSGTWEIDGGVQAVDMARGLIYFVAANTSTSRHVYSIPLPTRDELSSLASGELNVSEPRQLTDEAEGSYYRTSFSPFGGYYVLDQQGPGVPWQKLVSVEEPNNVRVLANNTALAKVDAGFKQAEVVRGTIEINGVELNTLELRPPLMDVSGRTKYPVLFQVYGGPASQMVTDQWQRDWHHYLATSLEYIIVKVDPRGTGFKGRAFRMPVRKQLGILEAQDVVETARQWAKLPYIDEKRVGIWGWSYGGFLTNKVVETNSSVFTLAMSVAPVVDWRYYDSILLDTERYMSTPQLNPVGYRNSSIRDMDGFKNVNFALAHGSGDDNVHFLNTAALLDRFTVEHVRNFRFRMFTDSDHSIQRRGAYWELMHWLTDFLLERWGEGGRTKQRWKLRDYDWDPEGALDDKRERE